MQVDILNQRKGPQYLTVRTQNFKVYLKFFSTVFPCRSAVKGYKQSFEIIKKKKVKKFNTFCTKSEWILSPNWQFWKWTLNRRNDYGKTKLLFQCLYGPLTTVKTNFKKRKKKWFYLISRSYSNKISIRIILIDYNDRNPSRFKDLK